jgi:hypothetical protein
LNIQGEKVGEKDIIIFERGGENIEMLAGEKNVKVLVLNGEPINEPLFAYGPFVMNTQEEIIEAIQDFNNGKMGHL